MPETEAPDKTHLIARSDPIGLWGAYFLGKTALFGLGVLRFHLLWNAALLLLIAVPMPARLRGKRFAPVLREVLNWILAFLLLWNESWLPPLGYVVDFFTKYDLPSAEYILHFLGRNLLDWKLLGVPLLIYAYRRLMKRVYLPPAVIGAILLAGMMSAGGARGESLEGFLEDFFEKESKRRAQIDGAKLGAELPDFDILILHVCSLAWDDLASAGIDGHPFLSRFDLLFRRYNSVTAHSTPSALRLMRAPCGQPRHHDLYKEKEEVPRECYLFEQLRGAGFTTTTAFAHDGQYGDMKEFLRRLGSFDPPTLYDSVQAHQINFDGRPIPDTAAVLERWWGERQASGAPRAALYLNIITMHGGARRADDKNWWKRSRADHYREFFDKLARDIDGFAVTVSASGRRAALVFVPEHGLGLRATSVQREDIREIPLPYVTIVPVGVRLIGPEVPPDNLGPVLVEKPSGHLALAQLIGELMRRPAFADPAAFFRATAPFLPQTPYVAENSGAVVVEKDGGLFLLDKEGLWRGLPKDVEVGGGRAKS